MRSQQANQSGFTMLEIMIVVAIIGLLAAIAIPNFLRSRNEAQKKACISNLSQIESAKQQWGLENAKLNGDVPSVSDLIGPTLYLRTMPLCPAGGVYDFRAIGQNATCTLDGHTL